MLMDSVAGQEGAFQARGHTLSHVGCWDQPVCLEGVCRVCLDQVVVAVQL